MEVSLFGLAFVSHYINVVAGLELGLAFMVQHFRKQQHAFGLGANVHDDVGRRELEHRALEHVVLARRLCCLGGKAVEHGSKVVTWWRNWLFVTWLSMARRAALLIVILRLKS